MRQPIFAFSKKTRLIKKADFNRLFKTAKKVNTPHLIFYFSPNSESMARLGIAAAKSRVAKAIKRNQIKRIIRESFRTKKNQLNSYDILVVAKTSFGVMEKKQQRKIIDEQWLTLLTK